MSEFLRGVALAVIGSAGFALLFGVRKEKIAFASVGGGIVWAVYLICRAHLTDEILLCSVCAAAAGTAYCELFARILRTPATVLLIPSMIPLVPGGPLYYAMSAMFRSDRAAAAAYGMQTLKFAVGIAAGITVITVISRPLNYLTRRRR